MGLLSLHLLVLLTLILFPFIQNSNLERQRPDLYDNDVFWFVQLSDIHLQHPEHYEQYDKLNYFVKDILPSINPSFVIVTGDITDGKTEEQVASRQLFQWQLYYLTLLNNNLVDKDYWYDVKGNHDCVYTEKYDYFYNYSVSGIFNRSSLYTFDKITKNGKYRFIGANTVFESCPIIRFSLFGALDRTKLDRLENILTDDSYNHTVLFGHHPLSMFDLSLTNSNNRNLDDILTNPNESSDKPAKSVSVYLNGHLHQQTLTKKRSCQPYWEFEVADFKSHSSIRVVSIDKDLISFRDLDFYNIKSNIIIQITYPIDKKLYHENLNYFVDLTEVHFIYYSLLKVNTTNFKLIINNNLIETNTELIENNLVFLKIKGELSKSDEYHICVQYDSIKECIHYLSTLKSGISYSDSFLLAIPYASYAKYFFYPLYGILFVFFIYLFVLRRLIPPYLHKYPPNELYDELSNLSYMSLMSLPCIKPPIKSRNCFRYFCHHLTSDIVIYSMRLEKYIYVIFLLLFPIIPNTIDFLKSEYVYISYLYGTYYFHNNMTVHPGDPIVLFTGFYAAIYYPCLIYMVFIHGTYNIPNFKNKCRYYFYYILKYLLLIFIYVSMFVVFFVMFMTNIIQLLVTTTTYLAIYIGLFIILVE